MSPRIVGKIEFDREAEKRYFKEHKPQFRWPWQRKLTPKEIAKCELMKYMRHRGKRGDSAFLYALNELLQPEDFEEPRLAAGLAALVTEMYYVELGVQMASWPSEEELGQYIKDKRQELIREITQFYDGDDGFGRRLDEMDKTFLKKFLKRLSPYASMTKEECTKRHEESIIPYLQQIVEPLYHSGNTSEASGVLRQTRIKTQELDQHFETTEFTEIYQRNMQQYLNGVSDEGYRNFVKSFLSSFDG